MTTSDDTPALTFKQRLFVDFYLGEANGNATEAARMAGYASPHPEGARLLRNATVRAAVESRLAGASLTAIEVLARLAEHATGDMGDLVDVAEDGTVTLDWARLKRDGLTRLIKKVKQGKYGIELELYDAQAALDKLARYHRLFAERVEHDFSKLSDDELIAQVMGELGLSPEVGRGDPITPGDAS